jgi:hypothetical protein
MPRITEKKKIDIDGTCVDNPVYCNWLNTRGGRDYWLFRNMQVKQVNVGTPRQAEPYQDDIENSIGYIVELEKEATPQMVVGAHVPIEKIEGIKGMLYSKDVLVLMNPGTWQTDGPGGTPKPVWQNWRVLPGSYRLYDTDNKSGSIEITLIQPFINIQAE